MDVILILDGHSSHHNLESTEFCIKNNIHLILLPPNMTQLLQPLDVGFFCTLKVNWKLALNALLAMASGPFITRENFCENLEYAIDLTINPVEEDGTTLKQPDTEGICESIVTAFK